MTKQFESPTSHDRLRSEAPFACAPSGNIFVHASAKGGLVILPHRWLGFAWILLCFVTAVTSVQGGTLKIGDLAPDFSLPEHDTQQVVNLYDYEGSVVLLDFFAYWCSHCHVAASELHPEIEDYYAHAGANPGGVPVHLIPISIDNQDPEAVSEFKTEYGLPFVLDDTQRQIFALHGKGYIPHLTIINGAAGANYQLWEILYTDAGYGRGQFQALRSIIDSVVVPEPCNAALASWGWIFLLWRRRRASATVSFPQE